MRPSATLVARAVAVALLLSACTATPRGFGGEVAPSGPAPATTTPAPAGLDAEARDAWHRWQEQGIDDYSYRLTVRCLCPPIDGKRVVVVDGHVVAVGDKSLDALLPLTGFGHLEPTVENLFRLLGGGQGVAGEVTVSFDSTTGIPTNIFVDTVTQAIDDEVSYAVDRFTPTVSE